MERVFFILCLLFFSNALPAQKLSGKKLAKHLERKRISKSKGSTVLSLDTIFYKGQAYAILKEKKMIPFSEFSLRSLQNDELIVITTGIGNDDFQTSYFQFYFTGSDKKAELEKEYNLRIEKVIVENDLVRNDEINAEREMSFLMKFPCRFSDPGIKRFITDKSSSGYSGDNIYEPVKRNKGSKIYFREGKILQDYKLIGYYKTYESLMRFYLPNNIMIAEVLEKEGAPAERLVTSIKDRKTSTISVTSGKELEEIASFLCENNYL